MAMEKIKDFDQVKKIAKQRGLSPGKVKGTEGIQFTKGQNDRLVVITWDEFEQRLKDRGLAVYQSNAWMKIMKDKKD